LSKQYRIRWTKSDNQELARVVRNYNAKVKRLAQNPSRLRNETIDELNITNETIKNALPELTSVKQLKSLINTRQDLKRELNTLKRFSEKGAEELTLVPDTKYNVIVTKWQRKEMGIRTSVINRRRKSRLEKLQATKMKSRGQDLGYTLDQIGMGRIEEVSLKPFNAFTPSMRQMDVRYKWKHIMHESQSDYFDKQDYAVKENFLKGLRWNFDYNDTKDLIEHIEKMPIDEFLKRFNHEGGTFEWLYIPEYDEEQNALKGLKQTYGLEDSLETSSEIITTEIDKKQKKKKKKKSKTKKRG
jgi:hypothetical protein